ncbi:MAG: class I SAM-dependent methyltransferase [Candidatus Zixiibacteriota bacterium]
MADFTVEIFDRLQDEADFFDREAEKALAGRRSLRFTNTHNYEQYFSHQRCYSAVREFFGKIEGKSILDFACGTGWTSIYFARSGAKCYGIDISAKSIEVANKTADLNGLQGKCEFCVAAGESLPYRDNTFDFIFGNAALHHVDLEMAPEEIARVLKPGGKAAFIDDLRYHPVLWAYRHLTRRKHTLFEEPLVLSDLRWFRPFFSEVDAIPLDIFNLMPKRKKFAAAMSRLDDSLLTAMPALKNVCRYVVIKVVK